MGVSIRQELNAIAQRIENYEVECEALGNALAMAKAQNSLHVAEIGKLREALRNARSQLSALGGTAGVHMSDADAVECGCDMIQRAVIIQIDAALKE